MLDTFQLFYVCNQHCDEFKWSNSQISTQLINHKNIMTSFTHIHRYGLIELRRFLYSLYFQQIFSMLITNKHNTLYTITQYRTVSLNLDIHLSFPYWRAFNCCYLYISFECPQNNLFSRAFIIVCIFLSDGRRQRMTTSSMLCKGTNNNSIMHNTQWKGNGGSLAWPGFSLVRLWHRDPSLLSGDVGLSPRLNTSFTT